MTGAEGKDEILDVPLGTIIRDAETGEIEGEITEEGQEIIVVPGGRGGLGNDHFKSSTNQTRKFHVFSICQRYINFMNFFT